MPEIGLGGLMLDYPLSGGATYARNLVGLLPVVAPDMRFYLFVRNSTSGVRGIEARVLSSPLRYLNSGKGVGARIDKLAWEIINLPLASLLRNQSLIHSLYFAAPLLAATPIVVTVHDLIPLVVPGYHRSRQSAYYSRLMAAAVKRAAAIITVSHYAKEDIVRVLRVPPCRVHVTYEAADERLRPATDALAAHTVRQKYRLPDRFLLYLGGGERRKNLETLLRAWARVSDRMRALSSSLVVVATFPEPDALYPDTRALAEELKVGDTVRFVPRVDDDDKPHVYRAALGFCFPSRYEGFGLPPLEAMACGVPVIASDATSLPEVLGNGARLLDPDDIGGWAESMLHLVESQNERRDLRERGIRRAATFSWRRTAEETVRVYRQILDS
jgi:glycosyltransferase involved in cell wall biosynthesis